MGDYVQNMKFTKEDARRRVLNCAKQYHQKLLNKKMIIIYRERKDNAIRYIEVEYNAICYKTWANCMECSK